MTKSIETCRTIKKGVRDGEGEPRIYINEKGKTICEGYQVSEIDDEPYKSCKICKFNEFRERW